MKALSGVRHHALVMLILFVGLALSFGASRLVWNLENEEVNADFERFASFWATSIENAIEANIDSLSHIQSYYAASDVVERDNFKTFVENELSSKAGIQALEWIPRVRASERDAFESSARTDGILGFEFTERDLQGNIVSAGFRDEYFPVFYLEPLRGNESALGFDLGSNPARMDALSRSRDTGQPIATKRITLVQETEGSFGFLVFVPVYRNGTPTGTLNERRENLLGFALGVFRVPDIVEASLARSTTGESEQDMVISLYDRSAPIEEQTLSISSATRESEQRGRAPLRLTHAFDVGGRSWEVVVTSVDQRPMWESVEPWAALVAGLSLTGLLSVYVWAVQRRNSVVSRLVSEGTQELRRSNEELKAEVGERRRVQEALGSSEARTRSILNATVDGIITIDSSGTVESFNPAAERIFGYTANETIGNNVRMLMPEPYHSEHDGYLSAYLRTGTAKIIGIGREVVGLRKDGTTFPMDLAVNEVRIEKRQMFTGIVRDVTERKRAEQEIKDLAKFPNENPYPVLRISNDGKIIYANPSGLGLMSDYGTGVGQFVPEHWRQIIRDVAGSQQAGESEIEIGGRVFSFVIAPVADAGYVNLYGRDVTEQKQIDEMKDNFLSTVSHELRTPLTSIKGFAEILLDNADIDPVTQREFLGIINSESERLTRLVSDFLDLSRIEASLMNWNDSMTDMTSVIERTVASTTTLANEKELKVDTNLDPGLPQVWADDDRLIQVVTNLMSNAIKFTPEKGRITITTEHIKENADGKQMDMIGVSVSDTGIGIAQDDLIAVFDKFKQVGDTLTDKPRGTGLGLPICKEIVEHYGGRIWVNSELGHGSRFCFTIPIIQPTAPDQE